jgi:hypothetical protein
MLIVYVDELHEEYLQWVKRALDHVEIPLERSTKSASAVDAVKLAKRLKHAARGDDSYQEVWCVLDECGDLEEAIVLAAKSGIRVAVCRPSLAAWLLLHYLEPAVIAELQDVPSELSARLPDVFHGSRDGMIPLAGLYGHAVARAASADSTKFTTTIPELVDSIRASLRDHRGHTELPVL